jgi:rhodanese-related sulfurtransferase
MQQLSVTALAAWLADPVRPAPLLLDVREPWETAVCTLPQATLIPMMQLPARIGELDPQRPVVCVCHHGSRSLQVAMFLAHHGFRDVFNLGGGVDAWAREVDPSCPRY